MDNLFFFFLTLKKNNLFICTKKNEKNVNLHRFFQEMYY